jgi:hypothetical protein
LDNPNTRISLSLRVIDRLCKCSSYGSADTCREIAKYLYISFVAGLGVSQWPGNPYSLESRPNRKERKFLESASDM